MNVERCAPGFLLAAQVAQTSRAMMNAEAVAADKADNAHFSRWNPNLLNPPSQSLKLMVLSPVFFAV